MMAREEAIFRNLVIAVCVLTLFGTTALGYLALRQSEDDQQQLSALQDALDRAYSTDELARLQTLVASIESNNTNLQEAIDVLRLYNESLIDRLTELEEYSSGVGLGYVVPSGPEPLVSDARSRLRPSPPKQESIPDGKAAEQLADGWFVQIGSYAGRGMADKWLRRVAPSRGSAVILLDENTDRRLYRVRVVGLPSREEAYRVAAELQNSLDLEPLWIGR